MIHLVMLSGGSGSRLWPLSNSARSKQFLKVLRDERGEHVSMVQRVLRQIANIDAGFDITIATCANQVCSINQQVESNFALVVEPERRDTAPAIMLACAHLDLVQGASLDETVIVVPIDTFAEQDFYDQIVNLDSAVQSGVGDIVLLGVEPTYPSEKYGYIIPASADGGSCLVREFKEKPSKEMASLFIAAGGLWNCGVFAFKLSYARALTRLYVDCDSFDSYTLNYAALPKNSFDYEVVEKEESVAVLPYSGMWKDLGTWNTLSEEMKDPVNGLAIVTDVENVHVINETSLPMVVAGLKDSVVIATHDGILVSTKEASANIKEQVKAVGESRPMYEKRPWGEYRVLDNRAYSEGFNALTKELVLKRGRQLSYQRHACRSEVWTVVSGRGDVVLDGKVTPVAPGTVIDIQAHQMHAARALDDLHIIEVQLGFPLVEDDIERFGNFWN